MSTVAPEQTGFELDRFQWSEDGRLEVEGRWFGVRGRRFVRPVLTLQVAGGRRRLLAVLEHKPWAADEGAAWIAAFPWEGSHEAVGDAELEVGALTVDLPPPGGAERPGTRQKAESSAPLTNLASRKPGQPEEPKVVAPPEPGGEPVLRAAGESRQHLERDLASARAELGRIRARHEEELRAARAEAREATGRVEALEARAGESEQRAGLLEDEARRLRDELETVRESQGEQLTRMGASEAEARSQLARERERAAEVGGEAQRLRSAAAEADRLQDERDGTVMALEELREKHEEALAEIAKLRQAVRRSAAEAERLRAASRRPGARVSAEGEQGAPAARRPMPAPSKPGPAVRLIPREKPAPPRDEPKDEAPPAPEPEAPPAAEAAPPPPPYKIYEPGLEPEAEPEVPSEAEAPPAAPTGEAPPAAPTGEETQAFDVLADTPEAEATAPVKPAVPAPRPASRAQVPTIRPEPGAGAARLLGEDAIVPLEQRSALGIWGPRVVAVVLVVLLLIALALIVRGLT